MSIYVRFLPCLLVAAPFILLLLSWFCLSLFVMLIPYKPRREIYISYRLYPYFLKQFTCCERKNFIALCKEAPLAAIAYLFSIVSLPYRVKICYLPQQTTLRGSQALQVLHEYSPVTCLSKYVTIIFQSIEPRVIVYALITVPTACFIFISHYQIGKSTWA